MHDAVQNSFLILAWSHPTGTVLSLAQSLARGIEAAGGRALVVNTQVRDEVAALLQRAPRGFDRVISLGPLPLMYSVNDRPLISLYDAQILYWVLDPFIYDLEKFPFVRVFMQAASRSDRLGFLFPDRSYQRLVEALCGRRFIYMPFGAEPAVSQTLSIETATAPVLVVANLGQELTTVEERPLVETIRAGDPLRLPAHRQAGLAEHVMSNEATANVAAAAANFLQLDPARLLAPAMVHLLCAMDSSEKRRRRIEIIRSLRDVPMDVYGTGWRRLIGDQPNLRFAGQLVSHASLPALFARYRVLLDFAPNWDEGFNDRVLPALTVGCRVVTTVNRAVAELGESDALVRCYSMSNPAPSPLVLEALRADPPEPHLLDALRRDHSWSARAALICAMAR
jgi:hypothetical protein